MSENQVKFIECFYEKDTIDYDGIEKLVKDGYTPKQIVSNIISSMANIYYVDIMSSLRFVKFLVENGLDINEPHFNPNKYSYYSFVCICIIYGDLEVIEYILGLGAEINKLIQGPGINLCVFAPVHLVNYSIGDKDAIFSLLEKYNADFTLEDSFGETAKNNK